MSGDGEIRTLDPLLARQVLSQLSYTPGMFLQLTSCPALAKVQERLRTKLKLPFGRFHQVAFSLGLNGLEPSTSRLSGVRSNLLSYKPISLIRQPPAFPRRLQRSIIGRLSLNLRVRDENGCFP